jgi:hypothetical protein
VSHFLVDYQAPRQRAVEKLGLSIIAVMDGVRPATPEERVDAVLARTAIGTYAHFMHRDAEGITSPAVANSETLADRLAVELLAPERRVRDSLPLDVDKKPFATLVGNTAKILVRRFGLPRAVARTYAARLCRSWFGGPSVRERLGIT